MILLGDIGGTNCRLALVKERKKDLFNIKVYKSKLFESIIELLEHYLKESFQTFKIKTKIKIAVFALAGPILNNEAFLTNLNWKVSSEEIKNRFNFEKVIILNDLEALAGCLSFLKKEDLIFLRDVKPLKNFPKAFLAFGTGLGEAILVKEKPLTVLPTEAGHTFFSPLKEDEWNFLSFLAQKGEELSWENAISGKALSLWYEFFSKERVTPERITSLAKSGHLFAKQVIFKVLELMGRKISQTALTSLPWGGIYLAGGVVLGIKDFLLEKKGYVHFQKGFLENFKMKYLLEKFPIYLIQHPVPGLLGALSTLRNRLK